MPKLDDLLDKAFGSKEKTSPPRAPPKILKPPSEPKSNYEPLALDFSYLTNNSSFQRSIIEFVKKYIPGFEDVNPRASKQIMTKTFNTNLENYKACMVEMKEVFAKRKKLVEEGMDSSELYKEMEEYEKEED